MRGQRVKRRKEKEGKGDKEIGKTEESTRKTEEEAVQERRERSEGEDKLRRQELKSKVITLGERKTGCEMW